MKAPERYRVKTGRLGTTAEAGNNGIFVINKKNKKFQVIASDGMGWDHVSVTLANRHRCPTWGEMCFIKDLFFPDDEQVVQFHPAKSEHVNINNYCLHLWRYQDSELPKPLEIMV